MKIPNLIAGFKAILRELRRGFDRKPRQRLMPNANITQSFFLICILADLLGKAPLVDHEGLWIHNVNDLWSFAFNAHPEASNHMGLVIPGFHCGVFYSGEMVALLQPFYSQFFVNAPVNENSFINALQEAVNFEVLWRESIPHGKLPAQQ